VSESRSETVALSRDSHESVRAVAGPPEPVESRERWRQALAEYEARKARTAALRAELAAARATAKAIRHARRLAYAQQRRKR